MSMTFRRPPVSLGGRGPNPQLMGLERVLFLDVDGVLHPAFVQFARQQFRPQNMRLLKALVETGRLTIVLSSSWRLNFEAKQHLKKVFEYFRIPIWVSQTPSIGMYARAREILAWVSKYQPRAWAAIDDWSLLLETRALQGHFLQTNPKTGLTAANVEAVLRLYDAQVAAAAAPQTEPPPAKFSRKVAALTGIPEEMAEPDAPAAERNSGSANATVDWLNLTLDEASSPGVGGDALYGRRLLPSFTTSSTSTRAASVPPKTKNAVEKPNGDNTKPPETGEPDASKGSKNSVEAVAAAIPNTGKIQDLLVVSNSRNSAAAGSTGGNTSKGDAPAASGVQSKSSSSSSGTSGGAGPTSSKTSGGAAPSAARATGAPVLTRKRIFANDDADVDKHSLFRDMLLGGAQTEERGSSTSSTSAETSAATVSSYPASSSVPTHGYAAISSAATKKPPSMVQICKVPAGIATTTLLASAGVAARRTKSPQVPGSLLQAQTRTQSGTRARKQPIVQLGSSAAPGGQSFSRSSSSVTTRPPLAGGDRYLPPAARLSNMLQKLSPGESLRLRSASPLKAAYARPKHSVRASSASSYSIGRKKAAGVGLYAVQR
ncbi:unnamed protein product [Amoebophrya sp. A25]|nr:unnamed protein product [Amoebophrya sp. A25]|eukprot:GSA25T00009754001.1